MASGPSHASLYRALLRQLPDRSLLVFDADLRVTHVHAPPAGWTAEEMLGRSIVELLPHADALHARYRAVLRGEEQAFEWPSQRAPGRWWTLKAVPVLDEDGAVAGGMVLAHDITASRAGQAQLRFQTRVIDEIDAAVLAVDATGNVSYWNRGAELLLGVPSDGAVGRPLAATVRLASERLREEIGQAVRRGETWKGEADLVRADGSQVPVFGSASFLDGEDGGVFVGVAFDISERRSAEERLRASETRFRTMVESSRDGVWALDAEHRTSFVNPRIADMLGHPPEAMLGRPMADFVDETELAALKVSLDRRRAGVSEEREVTFRRSDGEPLYAIVSTNPLTDGDGAYTGSLSMVTDITERVLDEREREHLRAALHQSQKLEGIGRLAGGVAHDFNNLLSVILNYAEFVADEVTDRPDVAADVREIVAAAERAASLTRQLLVFSRRDVAKPMVLDVADVIEDMEKLLRRTLGEDIALHVRVGAGPARVRADRGQLEQILLNLALNARAAMPSGGELRIRAERRILDELYLRSRPGLAPGAYVVLSVEDTGVGMDSVVVARAFEPFFTTKPPGEGTGLGLATVYGVVTEAGGHVELYSEPGHGTTVRIHLPAVDAAVAEESRPRADAPRGDGELVLIVEDEAPVRELAARVLRAHGYDVRAAPDADAALALPEVAEGRVDLLLTDIVMPGMSGPELAGAMRGVLPDLPVLYTSGYTDDALVRHGIREDQVAFLEKPFTAVALLEQVRATLAD